MKHPLPLFLVVGAALAGARALLPAPPALVAAAPAPVVVEAARIERLLAAYTRSNGEPPGAEEREAIIDAEVRDRLLLRAALDAGLDRIDPRISWRLMEKMRFLGLADESDPAATVRRARAMGLAEHDVVIERMMIEKMGTVARYRAEQQDGVDPGALEEFFRAHRDRWTLPQRTSFRQLFFPGEEAAGRQAAEQALAALRESGRESDPEVSMGMPFAGGVRFRSTDKAAFAKLFGGEFADAVAGLPLGAWSGPLRSAQGWHLVLVEAREERREAELEQVRGQVAAAFRADRGDRGVDRFIEELRRSYVVSIESGYGDRSAGRGAAGAGNA